MGPGRAARVRARVRARASGLWQRLVLLGATGAIFSACSEFWFYRLTGDVGQVGLILAYGWFGYTFVLTLRLFQVRAFSGFFVAAGIFGFLVEGTLVPVLYLNLPFSIAWTSLGWHALFSVSVGYYLYRRIMAGASARAALVLNGALGTALGIWNAYLWNVVESPGGGVASYDWQPTGAFALQFLSGWALFLGGHMLLDRFPPCPARPPRLEFALFLGVPLGLYAAAFLDPLFPLSLILPLLLLVSLASLGAGARVPAQPWLDTVFSWRIAKGNYRYALLIPVMAIATYAVFKAARLEWETNVLVATPAVLVSSLYWFYALLRANHAGR